MANIKEVWAFAKPVIIIVLAVAGYFQEILFDKDVSSYIFIAIIGLSLLFRWKSIIGGFGAIINAIRGKK